jgi:hypothetical protein
MLKGVGRCVATYRLKICNLRRLIGSFVFSCLSKRPWRPKRRDFMLVLRYNIPHASLPQTVRQGILTTLQDTTHIS